MNEKKLIPYLLAAPLLLAAAATVVRAGDVYPEYELLTYEAVLPYVVVDGDWWAGVALGNPEFTNALDKLVSNPSLCPQAGLSNSPPDNWLSA
ncbi:MAG: hypothetical protein JW781_06820 [Deltaproteobacteria bacterium]|nr:hypothetical protein [Candidatus Anaeroferrophillacea bacterium]